MNNLIESILIYIMNGDEGKLAMLSCYYVPIHKEEKGVHSQKSS